MSSSGKRLVSGNAADLEGETESIQEKSQDKRGERGCGGHDCVAGDLAARPKCEHLTYLLSRSEQGETDNAPCRTPESGLAIG
jgi:hypothetical protein